MRKREELPTRPQRLVILSEFSTNLLGPGGVDCCTPEPGISAISSVPYAFSEVFPVLTLGTWTYIFQGVLVLSLMVLQRQFVPSYLCSFVVAVFGDLLDRRFRFKTAPALARLRGVEAE